MKLETLRTYKKILIVGYGLEGHATEEFLKKFHPTCEIGFADQKDGPDYLERQADYDLAIRTPLLRPEKMTIPYTTGTRIFMANSPHRKIGITGTKGKSTAVSLLHHILKESGSNVALYGNIGDPMIHALTHEIPADTTIILEMSSYQLEDCEYSPQVACFLNIYHETHNHPSYDNYLHAKYSITTHQTAEDDFFYNGQIPDVAMSSKVTHAQIHDFTTCHVEKFVDISALPFKTHTDTLNAVLALCQNEGISGEEFAKHCVTFKPLAHRLSHIGTFREIRFYDDSASIHPTSTIFALATIQDIDVLIVGGDDRGYDMSELAEEVQKKHISVLVLMGDTGKLLKERLKAYSSYHPTCIQTDSLQEAVEVAYTHTQPGHACVLSSGAPSYGLFTNLQERGDIFAHEVLEYAKKQTNTHS